MCLVLFSCEEKTPSTPKDLAKEFLIPKPDSLLATGSSFRLTKKTQIVIQDEFLELRTVGIFLANKLQPATGFKLPISLYSEVESGNNIIYLSNDLNNDQLGVEGYELIIVKTLLH